MTHEEAVRIWDEGVLGLTNICLYFGDRFWDEGPELWRNPKTMTARMKRLQIIWLREWTDALEKKNDL